MNKQITMNRFYRDIKTLIIQARKKVYKAVNFSIIECYWYVGKRIVEEEQKGRKRAGYGEYLISDLSKYLTKELGKGYTEANLRNFRQFYLVFPTEEAIRYALRNELSWTHYRLIMRVDNPQARRGSKERLEFSCSGTSDKFALL